LASDDRTLTVIVGSAGLACRVPQRLIWRQTRAPAEMTDISVFMIIVRAASVQ
jgi:hypothetical protein